MLLVEHNKSELYEWGELFHSHSGGIRLPTEIS